MNPATKPAHNGLQSMAESISEIGDLAGLPICTGPDGLSVHLSLEDLAILPAEDVLVGGTAALDDFAASLRARGLNHPRQVLVLTMALTIYGLLVSRWDALGRPGFYGVGKSDSQLAAYFVTRAPLTSVPPHP